MSQTPRFDQFLASAFSAAELHRWAEGLAGDEVTAELPGLNSPVGDIASAIYRALRRRHIPPDEIFDSLLRERPFRIEEISRLRRAWSADTPEHEKPRRWPYALSVGVALLIMMGIAVPLWSTEHEQAPKPSLRPVQKVDVSPVVVPPIVVQEPARKLEEVDAKDAAKPVAKLVQKPTLRVALTDCHGCEKPADAGGTPRFCNHTAYALELSSPEASHVTLINYFDGQWRLGDEKYDLDLMPATPATWRARAYTASKGRSVVSESIVAVGFRDAADRQAYRSRFGATRAGPAAPTATELSMDGIMWEEARFDYEIDPTCR